MPTLKRGDLDLKPFDLNVDIDDRIAPISKLQILLEKLKLQTELVKLARIIAVGTIAAVLLAMVYLTGPEVVLSVKDLVAAVK